jgi:MPBQ/MSBQ methyltransferase
MNVRSFVRRYDRAILDPAVRALYGGTDFYNHGDWSVGPDGPPRGLGEAACRLVDRHLAVDPPECAGRIGVVLDVGCGLGPSTKIMARRYPATLVLGVNLSAAQLRRAVATPSAARFAAMDAVDLAIASNAVDRVHAVEAAFHFDTRLGFLREAHRVLRPGGKLVLSDILYSRRVFGVPEENYWLDEADYREQCAGAGFVVESLEDITHDTVEPSCDYLAAKGRQAFAKALRRAIDAYWFVVLRRP